jgi:hypothetical protein
MSRIIYEKSFDLSNKEVFDECISKLKNIKLILEKDILSIMVLDEEIEIQIEMRNEIPKAIIWRKGEVNISFNGDPLKINLIPENVEYRLRRGPIKVDDDEEFSGLNM